MSNYHRPQIPGACVFFTVALADRRSDLLTRHIDVLRAAVVKTRRERPFDISAWVVLPNHMHSIWTLPEGDRDFSTRWRLIKTRFSRAMAPVQLRQSHIKRRERGVWQRRFWEHHIRDDADFETHLNYCWMNPVRHGLVDRPQDWPYSRVLGKGLGVVRASTHPTQSR